MVEKEYFQSAESAEFHVVIIMNKNYKSLNNVIRIN